MRSCLLIFFLLLAFASKAQMPSSDTRTKLEEQRKEILQQINETENELTLLRSNKKITLNQLKVLQDKLDERQKLIENYNDEIKYINQSIEAYNNQIASLKKKLEKYKKSYSQSIRYSYKSRNTYSFLAYLCSSGDFNDMVRRMRYLKILRALRKQQAEKIRNTHAELYHKIDLLNAEKGSKDKLLAELVNQNKTLVTEKNESNTAVKDISGREKELIAELVQKKNSAKRINDAIQATILREMKHSEETAAETIHKTHPAEQPEESEEEPKPKEKLKEPLLPAITKGELDLAKSFEKAKGKLNYPVEKGNISGHFGKYSIKNIDYFNNGVDIHTITYGIVSAVFEGNVSSVVEMDGKTIIIVQHGNYFTVYNNLMKTLVLKGQHVVAKQPLGLVANNEDGYPTLNFQIWRSGGSKHETAVLDPEAWLGKKK